MQYNYQPYACLTYYPFLIDLCPLITDPTQCAKNPNCLAITDPNAGTCSVITYTSKSACEGAGKVWTPLLIKCIKK
jgi:hypothetical protein